MADGFTALSRRIWSNPVLSEPGREFSRREAWLFIVNKLAQGVDDPATGLKRGEFEVSIRYLAKAWKWSKTKVQRFLSDLEEGPDPMISRVGHFAGHFSGHFKVCKYEVYNPARDTSRDTSRDKLNKDRNKDKIKDTHQPCGPGACGPDQLFWIFAINNQSLPKVKEFTPERRRRAQARINQAERDGCLSQYLEDFTAAVKKAQSTPFLRGEGARNWRASFDWLVANHTNVYAVLEGKYDGSNGNGSKPGSAVSPELSARRCTHDLVGMTEEDRKRHMEKCSHLHGGGHG